MLNFLKPRQKDPATDMQQRYPRQRIGRYSYGSPEIHDWGEGARLEMGSFCSVAAGVQIFLGGEHRTDWVTTFPFNVLWPEARDIKGHPRTKGDVRIGNDVWIGFEAVILSGVTIGDGAVIGTRAVVSKDVPAYAVVAGNPAQVMRFRFPETVIARLVKAQWWTWDDTRIAKHLPLMLSGDIEGFLEAAEEGTV
ncbi:CatB-related O-acetyltransferase [soil metagenome]